MEYGAMFGSLDGYVDREYFDAHRTGTLTVIKGAEYKITFFASCKAQATEKVIFDPPKSNNQALLDYLNEHAFIYDPSGVSAGLKLIALSTCQSAESNERIIVFGVLTQQDQ
jgi:sortase B